MPKVTIFTQVYNAGKWLDQCVSSMLSQTYQDFEYLLVDSCSTDGSAEKVKAYGEKDPRIKTVLLPENLPGIRFEIVKQYGTGEYFVTLDHDDWIEPNFLERLITFAEENNLDLAITGVSQYFEKIHVSRTMRQMREPIVLTPKQFAQAYAQIGVFAGAWWASVMRLELFLSLEAEALEIWKLDLVWRSDTISMLKCIERLITTLPMNYTYGLSVITIHLLVGAEILFTEKGMMQKEFWTFFKEYGATSFGGVPYIYKMLDKLRFTRMDLPSLRTITQAGGKLQPELQRKFAAYAQETGKRLYIIYGQTEATASMSYLPYQMALKKFGSMGIAMPGGSFSVIDEEGRLIKTPHTTGELVYEGPNVTLGYAERGEDLASGDERHGRLETGDMVEFDEDGYYFITGRKKRFLKIFGNRVNLDEIDSLVKGRFDGVDCASSGQDDALHLYITEASLIEDVRKFVAEKTGLHFSVFVVRAVPSIPRNESGKVLYQELVSFG